MQGEHEAMDAETVAGLLGVSTRQLNNYINLRDLPSTGSGRRRTFVWREVLEWYVRYRTALELGDGTDGSEPGESDDGTSDSDASRKEDIRGANLRKTRAEADLKQLALSRQRSEVITIADAKVRLDRMLGNMRSKLLGLAPKLANRIEGLKARTEREAVLKEEMEVLCRALATGAVVDLPVEPESVQEISAAEDPAPSLTDAELDEVYDEVLDLYAAVGSDAAV